ncbi:hypothetical protein OHU45_07695 [Streptomyces tubercidicus]|uniref:hypothetical protein n=1 Tax=Streptomyces tubercidicus TaxID=47759 RepID=UPI0030E11D6A
MELWAEAMLVSGLLSYGTTNQNPDFAAIARAAGARSTQARAAVPSAGQWSSQDPCPEAEIGRRPGGQLQLLLYRRPVDGGHR